LISHEAERQLDLELLDEIGIRQDRAGDRAGLIRGQSIENKTRGPFGIIRGRRDIESFTEVNPTDLAYDVGSRHDVALV